MWHFILHLLQYNYAPLHEPFYYGAIWGNLFVVPVAFVLGVIWAHSKYWPLKPIEHSLKALHRKSDALADSHKLHAENLNNLTKRIEELHDKHNTLIERLEKNQKPVSTINVSASDAFNPKVSRPSR